MDPFLFMTDDTEESIKKTGLRQFQVLRDDSNNGLRGTNRLLKREDPENYLKLQDLLKRLILRGLPADQFWDLFTQCTDCRFVMPRQYFPYCHPCVSQVIHRQLGLPEKVMPPQSLEDTIDALLNEDDIPGPASSDDNSSILPIEKLLERARAGGSESWPLLADPFTTPKRRSSLQITALHMPPYARKPSASTSRAARSSQTGKRPMSNAWHDRPDGHGNPSLGLEKIAGDHKTTVSNKGHPATSMKAVMEERVNQAPTTLTAPASAAYLLRHHCLFGQLSACRLSFNSKRSSSPGSGLPAVIVGSNVDIYPLLSEEAFRYALRPLKGSYTFGSMQSDAKLWPKDSESSHTDDIVGGVY
ncbi:hypothetical protein NMY22_g7437 [Coprinellus aureogranulatus]|nr:hypothetical protein NMY22_g7437 [Coprinellus aureogranulatus]